MGYETLEVYEKAFELALEIHKQTLGFPKIENYELGSQLRRASKSVCLNIAECYGRKKYDKDFSKFLINAIGSANESRVCLRFAYSLGYLDKDRYDHFSDEYNILGKRVNTLISKLLTKATNS